MKNIKIETIDEYIAVQPIEKRASLEKIRSIIQKAAPKATEVISYGMPAFKQEGILVGISTGASLAAVAKKLAEIPVGSKVLTFNYDTGERYLSIEGLF